MAKIRSQSSKVIAKSATSQATPPSLLTAPLQPATIQRAAQDARKLTPGDIQQLQGRIGNQAVIQLMSCRSPIPQSHRPAKLEVELANDHFEQEANRVSQQVSEHKVDNSASIRRSALPASTLPTMSIGPEGGLVDSDLQARIQQGKAGGQSLPSQVQRKVGAATGADFSGVRVHNDNNSHKLNTQLQAKAFTHSNHIFLGKNQSPHDVQLMAHELTHTVQQGAVQQNDTQQTKALQRVSNRSTPATLGHGAKTIQRFSIDDEVINWEETTEAKRSQDGGYGVVFAKDGAGNTIVLKASKDPIGETHLANLLHDKVSGVQTVKSREISDDRFAIILHVLTKIQGTQEFRDNVRDGYTNTDNRVWAFGLAKGKSFLNVAQDDPSGRAMDLLNDPAHLYQLGRMTAVDLFLGNTDRLKDEGRANTGNWMVDDEGGVTAIDNMSYQSLLNLQEYRERLGARKQARAQGNKPGKWEKPDVTPQDMMDELAPSRIKQTAVDKVSGLLKDTWFAIDWANKALRKAGQQTHDVPYTKELIPEMAQERAPLLAAGLKAGRDELIRKLAPKTGKRSRTIKNEVVGREGGLGMTGWKEIKKHARYLRDLKTKTRKPGKWKPK